MDMVLWEGWLGLKVDQLLLYVPYAIARFSKLFIGIHFCLYQEGNIWPE